MTSFGKASCGAVLLSAVLLAGGCGQPKAPPPGAPADAGAPPTVDLGPPGGPNQGAGIDPSQSGAGQIAREPGISGEGQAPEQQKPNTGSP